MRLVIADDSVVVRNWLINQIMDLDGVEVVGQAADAPEARKMVQVLRPDVVILDIGMPSGSGADLVPGIKLLNPAPKMIMFTNYSLPENRKQCMDRGADYFLDKSMNFRKVVSVLKRLQTGSRGN